MPTAAEQLEEVAALRRAVTTYQLPATVRGNVNDAAQLARFDHLRQLAAENTLEGLAVAERLIRANHLAEAEAITDRAVGRWRRWLRQVQTFNAENYERNAGLGRELSTAFDGAVDLIVEQLPAMPTLPQAFPSGLALGLGAAFVAWLFARKATR